jgi:hypothetical protein
METVHVVRVPKAPEPNSQWRLIRDQRVREAEVRAEIEGRRLEEKGKVLVERKAKVDAEVTRMGESEPRVRTHRTLGRLWGAGLALTSLVMMVTVWWTMDWYLSLTWEKALIALTLFILPLIGWAVFLIKQRVEVSSRFLCGLGLAVVVCSVAAAALLVFGRMVGVQQDEERQQTTATQTTGELTGTSSDPSPNPTISRAKKVLAVTGAVSAILLAIAAEIAAGLAFHEYYRHMTVVWTAWPYYREQADLPQAIADNIAEQEEVKRQPEILYAQLTAAGLEAEAAYTEKVAAEARSAEERAVAEARAAAEAEVKANSLGRVVKIVLVSGLVLVLSLLVAAAVFAGERHVNVVVLDLSVSMASDEFARNLQAVEGIIGQLAPETRLVVLGVTEASFSAAPLFVQTSPKNAGRFGEYLSAWRGKAIREWRLVAGGLQPTAKGSDILGALARASTEFEEAPQASKTLILLSDMRHVGQGVNLEKGPPPEVSSLEQRGLLARLQGVQVWMLGVHTAAIDVGQWRALKVFWCEYFQRAGAVVKLFSPNRRATAA